MAILGFGAVEGRTALRHWSALGASVTVLDRQPKRLPRGVARRFGDGYDQGLDAYDVVVRTPSFLPERIHTSGRVTSVAKEFVAHCPAPIVGVTGTKGKGTTATLIARILRAAGRTVWVGGNIGVSPLDFLPRVTAKDLVVLELSSFQLADFDTSPHVAVCLPVAPDHLDVHPDFEDYKAAKRNVFAHQHARDVAVFHPGDPACAELASASPGRHVRYCDPAGAHVDAGAFWFRDRRIADLASYRLPGPHNRMNACAAIAATWDLVGDPRPIERALRTFKGLRHRLELVRTLAGVRYYDDSLATSPEATVAAVQSFAEPKVLILGGHDKGVSFGPLSRAVRAGNVRAAILIGATAPLLEKALADEGFTACRAAGPSMASIVAAAREAAVPGDVVLLSPGCASFGLFRDYRDRGNQFRAGVSSVGD